MSKAANINESIFTEEEYSSERLEFYSPKRPKPGISLREQEFTEIRGRNYLLSPQKSPVKQKPLPINKQATQSILLEINEEPGLDSRKGDIRTRGSKVTKKVKRNLHIDSTKLHTARSDIDKKTDRKARRERERGDKRQGHRLTEEVSFSSAETEKWQPISQEALTLFNNIMVAALGESTAGLKGSVQTQSERQLQGVIREVESRLRTARAPQQKRPRLAGGARQLVCELKEECVALVDRNSELEEQLAERVRVVDELKTRTQQLGSIKQGAGSLEHHHAVSTKLSTARRADIESTALRETNNFEEYITNLLDIS